MNNIKLETETETLYIIAVKQALGHKRIQSTFRYTWLRSGMKASNIAS